MRVLISIVTVILFCAAFEASPAEPMFNFYKDQSYGAAVRVPVGPIPHQARYLHFTMQVPECTKLKHFYAYEGRGDGEKWLLEAEVMVVTDEPREYFVPLSEEIGRQGWAIDLKGKDWAVLPTLEAALHLRGDAPKGDGKLDPAAVDELIFYLEANEGIGSLGAGSYKAWGLEFGSESPIERALGGLDEIEIDVNAAHVVGDVNPIWRDIFLGLPQTLALPQRTVRIMDALPGTRGAFPQNGLDGEYNWEPSERALKLAQPGEIIMQCVGRDVPKFLWDPDDQEASSQHAQWAVHGIEWFEGNLRPPNDMKAYEELYVETAKYYNEVKGYNIQYFEFWTEPDGLAWYHGTAEEYAKMYAAFARGIKRGDPNAKVGCPGITNYNIPWLRVILKHCVAHDVPLDFISLHHYGSHARAFGDVMVHLRNLLESEFPKYKDVELIWSEWNNQIVTSSEEAIAFKSTAAHAAFAADALGHMTDAGVNIATFAFAPGDDKLWKGMGLFLPDQKTPKPVYNTLRLFTAMEGTDALRVDAKVNADEGLGIGAFAVKADEHVAISTWWNLEIPDPPGLNRTGTLRIAGIPFSGEATLERYLIDDHHSNFAAGSEHQDLERVETTGVTVTDGTLEIPIEIAVSSVQLFKILPASAFE